jgi:hypothetical protein
VFFTVELCRPNNMGVLNSVIVRRNKLEKNGNSQRKDVTSLAAAMYGNDAAGTGLSLKLRGSHKFRGSVDIGSMMNRLQSDKTGVGAGEDKSVMRFSSRRANIFYDLEQSSTPFK